jgi:exosortase D (VPLPA-CTERM-specific)
MFKAALWKRLVVFTSSIPVTIGMNSLRIGLIGVTVDRWGVGMAEGFLHDFEGWVVFMCSASVLLLEMILLSHIGASKKSWRALFGFSEINGVNWPEPVTLVSRKEPLLVSLVSVGLMAVGTFALPARAEIIPQRADFAEFSESIARWHGRREPIEQVYLDVLKLNDYVMLNYVSAGRDPINFYVAWYDSQRSGQSAHSPRTCLPGGGWRIMDLQTYEVAGVAIDGVPLQVNRAVIASGEQQQLVYYWFQQRGRVITNEYLVKWYLFWDSLTRNRTDGALVRLTAPLVPGASVEQADRTLTEFVGAAAAQLPRFIPN